MKSLLVLSIIFMSFKTFAGCTDFTGEYTTEVGTYYSISQDGCETLFVNDETGTNERILDGAERLIAEYDIVIEGGKVIAHIQSFLSSKMVNEKLIYNERTVYAYASGGQEEEKSWAEISFNEETDLQTVFHNSDGSTETIVDIRYKSLKP